MNKQNRKIDTRAIGLDVSLAFARWLTGREHLHYGLWTGLEVTAANLLAAQEAYSDRLLALLPARSGLRILDIGGGAGETAKRLIAAGHAVEIVVPSPFLAGRCAENAPQAVVHQTKFEDFRTDARFDVCLFSESFQYVPLAAAIDGARALLEPGGCIVIGDCFRAEGFREDPLHATVGGGHKVVAFRAAVAERGLRLAQEADITAEVAPSVDLEQAFFNVIGHAATRTDAELAAKRPWVGKVLRGLVRLMLGRRRQARLVRRLMEKTRNAEAFRAANRYLLMRLEP